MTVRVLHGDALTMLRTLPDASVQCCVTSPPYYGLRDYGTGTWEGGDPTCSHKRHVLSQNSTLNGGARSQRGGHPLPVCVCGARRIDRQIGLEQSPDAYIARLVEVFREVRRVLRSDGVCFVNMGDSYSSGGRSTYGSFKPDTKQATNPAIKSAPRPAQPDGIKPKDLLMMPSRLAIALQADGWWLRSMMPWVKRSCMPESTTDRPTSAIEYVFMLTRSARYYWDAEAVKRAAPYGAGERFRGDKHTNGASFENSADLGSTHGGGRPGPGGSRNFRNSDLFFDSLGVELSEQRAPKPPQRIKPDGWDLGNGGHGTIHRNGRTAATYAERKGGKRDEKPRNDGDRTGSNGLGEGAYWSGNRSSQEPFGLICDEAGEPLALDVNPEPFPDEHFATYPTKLIEPLIRAASRPDDTVLDPFLGSGTTALVSDRLGRDCIGIELNDSYIEMARNRLTDDAPMFAEVL